ncbi:cullin, a subunit of E3 ubiquitin ligase [Mycolicibacterium phlei]|jgi:hypothetical protein|uniref:AbiEi antitoxin C-terminal domain-containing protein n=1 Tax=Mycolicibacterium phlei DSM 43239 = CCUG 21000 TaxID=1226750 RepID=A0A5N5VBI7_MYCPH|nr:hypothetical protein [Mycolicibacterium phlei]VEG07955.1 cullin, a subunit of E3 ubiquitin ligase [Mycobacteroides chelonae]AMO59828.1 hypothetical protein MPHLCCUG_00998 [Mycolicibacterium phlei]KAB7759281.1 hypothetical protein MPHL21000_03425 [Mycolicibacterium phlei DSM 43239 = CCUG 21000]KXW61085.1 hypothetical protein MPHL43070_06965 [Mycolicibacterium phlei DSM 43070]KXW61195.1 hypothetical protein MPHL43239_21395 [Mycolicibacterium phlei DSM 43239 = CCUG 21000]
MDGVFIGSKALAGGGLTRASLRWNYRALFPDVYQSKLVVPTLRDRIEGAFLWARGDGIISGRAAAAVHGARWVDANTPIEMLWRNGRPPDGIVVRNERIDADDIQLVNGLLVTSPLRTAFDLARHLPRDLAVKHLDALANATGVTAEEVLALQDRYPRARGLPRARIALPLMDGGAQSPQETRIRLILIDDGLPAPRTQVLVTDGYQEAYLDMAYEEPMVGFDYEGIHHSEDRRQYVHDIGRTELVEGRGWIDIRVVAEHSRGFILYRAYQAFARRGWTPPRRLH